MLATPSSRAPPQCGSGAALPRTPLPSVLTPAPPAVCGDLTPSPQVKYAVKSLDLALIDSEEGLRQLKEEIYIMCQLVST